MVINTITELWGHKADIESRAGSSTLRIILETKVKLNIGLGKATGVYECPRVLRRILAGLGSHIQTGGGRFAVGQVLEQSLNLNEAVKM